jgi:hypothetical protein
MAKKIPSVYLKSKLKLGEITLDCFVLDDDERNPSRILSQAKAFEAFGRPARGPRKQDPMHEDPELGVIKLPPFIVAGNLKPLITNEIIGSVRRPVVFMDGNQKRTGYRAEFLPVLCSLYLKARRGEKGVKLLASQEKIAKRAEILQEGFARIGIIALIDEATGFQQSRKYDALRILIQAYLRDEIQKWNKEFPDDFFLQLDKLYGNEKTTYRNRPQYYGHFINKYIYDELENGNINPELQARYKNDNKTHRKFQWFTEDGKQQFRLQMGRIMGLMEVSPSMRKFKDLQSRQMSLALFPDMD